MPALGKYAILRKFVAEGRKASHGVAGMAKILYGRGLLASPIRTRFRGAYGSYREALDAVPARTLAGYNHASVAEISFEVMCRLAPWDYPVLYWLQRLQSPGGRLLDAGGHMGTKFRAFQAYLRMDLPLEWIVYDVPAIVAEGRRRATADGLQGLSFTDDLATAPPVDILLASGLLQYLDKTFSDFIGCLARKPKHIIINKLALRDEETFVTLEDFEITMVPYQIRSRRQFFSEIEALGYHVVDEWAIPSLSHTVPTHPELGASQSIGCYLRLQSAVDA